MDRFTRSIAMASARHPWRTIASWIVVAAATFALAGALGGTFTDDFASPGSQSARALQLPSPTRSQPARSPPTAGSPTPC